MVRNLLLSSAETDLEGSLPVDLRDLAARCMPADLLDDRFDASFAAQLAADPSGFVAAVASNDDQLVGYLGGFLSPTETGLDVHLDLLIDRDHPEPVEQARSLLTLLRSALLASPAGTVESTPRGEPATTAHIWAKPSFAWHDTLADLENLEPERALFQMRAPLPIQLDPVRTRAFRPGHDNEAVRNVNNRAFAWHPDQGSQSTDDFDSGLAQDWVDPDGIRLHEVDGVLAGFCWTKIHHEAALGEIYVIAVDPAFHGRGLGKPMTAAGLEWLHANGLATAMLYVEADNEPALATYERLGFETVRTDRAWRWPLTQPEA